jgi:3-dehydroquinate synthase
MIMETIEVRVPAASVPAYEIRIGQGLLPELGGMVRAVAAAPSVGVVTDSNVAPLYLPVVRHSLEAAGYRVNEFVFPAGEASKNCQNYLAALDTLLFAGVERRTPVVALGGGVVGDLAGLVAASLLRGVPLIQVPTTLLAAVDSSVGGKVGIDHEAGKNLIGAFHQPRLVVTDIDTFRTLPIREVRCGLAECIKHAVIRDSKLFDFISSTAESLLKVDTLPMAELVAWNVAIKADIVTQDPFEQGIRALLNLGHTFGHALEKVFNYSELQHGEGVALGIVAAGETAVVTGRWSAEEQAAVEGLLSAVGLPIRKAGLDIPAVLAAMGTDKKVQAGKLRFILPDRIGHASVVSDVPAAAVEAGLRRLAKE